MAALPNPFLNSATMDAPVADRDVAPVQPSGATSRFDRHFDPVAFSNYITIGFPETMAADEPPLFLSDPSNDFIAAMHRDVLPMLEDLARRAG